ncbi:MAG: response regulator transcription factor [Acidobacteriota bacterium]
MPREKAKLRIILVNELENNQQSYEIALQRHSSFEIVAMAESVNQAIELVHLHSPDAVVIESTQIRAKNIDSVRRLKQYCPQVDIIMMSSQAEEAVIVEAIRAGAAGYIIKQNIGQELTDAIFKIEHGQIYLSPLVSKSILMYLDVQDVHPLSNRHLNAASPFDADPLTHRQKEILKLLVAGLTNKQIAKQLRLSVKTVDAHRANIMSRLKIHDLPGLVKYAIRTGLTSIEE